MKKLMISAFVLAAMGSSAMAGEQLTSAQLDQVTASGHQFAAALARQSNRNRTRQNAFAFSSAAGGCIVAICGRHSGNAYSSASAANVNGTIQGNSNAAVNID